MNKYEIYFNQWRSKESQYVVVEVTEFARESGYKSYSYKEVMSFPSFEDALTHVGTFSSSTRNSYGIKLFSEE
jgi:hypothetical protein